MKEDEALSIAWPKGLETRHLGSVEAAVTVGKTLRNHWFRGHDRDVVIVRPKVFRAPYLSCRDYWEYWLAEQFRLRAGTITTKVPNWDDYLSWLLLMQHHDLPTRLVDWSENVLVALYFATGGPYDMVGHLYCFDPVALNSKSGIPFICVPDSEEVRYLAGEVFELSGSSEARLKALNLTDAPDKPLAFLPSFGFPRMAAQASRFTIHPTEEPSQSIESILRDPHELVRYVIEPALKPVLRRDLRALGVTAETLFGSLEALALTVMEETLDPPYDCPKPPAFRAKGPERRA